VADKRHRGNQCWISSGEVGPPHRLNNERKSRAPWGKWGRRRSDEQNPSGGMAWSKTSTTKKLSLSKKSRGPCWYCECTMWERVREVNEVNDEASHTCQWRTRSWGKRTSPSDALRRAV
jgi:hypothetical protein